MTNRKKIVLAILGIVAVLVAAPLIVRNYTARKHQAAYQSTLSSFRANLKPGMMRAEVEGYIRSRGIEFEHFTGLDLHGEEESALADGIRLGREPAGLPVFVCEDSVVILELTFRAIEPGHTLTALESDVLVDVRLSRSQICI